MPTASRLPDRSRRCVGEIDDADAHVIEYRVLSEVPELRIEIVGSRRIDGYRQQATRQRMLREKQPARNLAQLLVCQTQCHR